MEPRDRVDREALQFAGDNCNVVKHFHECYSVVGWVNSFYGDTLTASMETL